jgi:hypothetical protein
MKKYLFLFVFLLSFSLLAVAHSHKDALSEWNAYPVGKINFIDKAPDTEGSKIYHAIIPDLVAFIQAKARQVLYTLYDSPRDSIPPVDQIDYVLEDSKGISAKGGGHGNIIIWYSTRHVEESFKDHDTTKVLYETAGVLFHELTHAYQLEPQGIGDYGSSKVFWAYIEGEADAVRVANGYFTAQDRPRGGSYMDGYRRLGFFLVWLRDHYDRNFLRKFNRSTLEVIPWSFDGAIKQILGKQYSIDKLWHQYEIEMGDIQA